MVNEIPHSFVCVCVWIAPTTTTTTIKRKYRISFTPYNKYMVAPNTKGDAWFWALLFAVYAKHTQRMNKKKHTHKNIAFLCHADILMYNRESVPMYPILNFGICCFVTRECTRDKATTKTEMKKKNSSRRVQDRKRTQEASEKGHVKWKKKEPENGVKDEW